MSFYASRERVRFKGQAYVQLTSDLCPGKDRQPTMYQRQNSVM